MWGIGGIVILVTVLCATLTIWDLYRKTSSNPREPGRFGHGPGRTDVALRAGRGPAATGTANPQLRTTNPDPEEFDRSLGGEATHSLLRERMNNLPQADALVIVDAGGHILNSSREWPVQRVDISDGDTYTHLRSSDGGALFISLPVRSRVTGNWTVYLGRRISGPDGVTAGHRCLRTGCRIPRRLLRRDRCQSRRPGHAAAS